MGTRNLTMVVRNQQYVVAKYCQWDGYPDGQGKAILDFLRNDFKESEFRQGLSLVYEPTKEQVKQWWLEVGVDIEASRGLVNFQQSEPFYQQHPTLSRNVGADILEWVQNTREPFPLRNNKEFAADSLFCEWAYVIDLDKRTFEVFEGFNQTPLSEIDRFFDLMTLSKNEYYPVKLKQSFQLDSLPDEDTFLTLCRSEEEEDDRINFADIIDEFAELYNRLSLEIDKLEKLRKQLAAQVKDDTSPEPISLIGNKYCVDYTPPSETSVLKVTPNRFLQETGCWDAVQISVTKAREALTPETMDRLFKKELGSRRFKRVRPR